MHHRHRRFVSLPLLALAGVPACFAPHDPVIVTAGTEEGGSADTSEGSASEGPTTSATSATGPTTGATSPSTSDPDGSSEGSGDTGASVCGDAMVDADEVCDDGINDGSYGGCSADCMSLGPHCGDSVTQAEEACDDGDDINGNGCNIDCVESGTVLWTRTVEIGSLSGVDVDEDDGVLVVSSTADLLYIDSEGVDGWSATYAYPGASSTSATSVSFDTTNDWTVSGRANTPTESYNIWWRSYSQAGAGGTTSIDDNPAHTADFIGGAVFDGGGALYVFGGADRDDLGQGINMWLRKYDSSGDELWTQNYDGGEDDYPQAIAIGEDDYVVVGGYTFDGGSQNSWLRKYGPEGTTEWTRTWANAEESWYLNRVQDVAVGPDLEVVATGVGGHELWVRKYAVDGDLEWTQTHAGPYDCLSEIPESCVLAPQGNGVAVDSAGAVIAVGHQQTDVHGVDMWIRKYDGAGSELWSDVVPGPNPDDSDNQTAREVVITSADDIVVVGAWDETGIGGGVLGWIQKYAP